MTNLISDFFNSFDKIDEELSKVYREARDYYREAHKAVNLKPGDYYDFEPELTELYDISNNHMEFKTYVPAGCGCCPGEDEYFEYHIDALDPEKYKAFVDDRVKQAVLVRAEEERIAAEEKKKKEREKKRKEKARIEKEKQLLKELMDKHGIPEDTPTL